MDKRYQVFVSSTFADLKEERQKVIQTLMELDCIPAGMELFPAADEEQWKFIKKVIDDCDYYVLIIGGRYGSLSSDGISYTEKEYDYAVSIGLQVLAFLHQAPEEITLSKSDIDSELRKKLTLFRDKVSEGRLVKYWRNASDLPGLVALSLPKTIKTYPAIGWVRADINPSNETLSRVLVQHNEALEENSTLQKRVKELELRIAVEQEISDLASLDDEFSVRLEYRQSRRQGGSLLYDDRNAVCTISWKEIFAGIAPDLQEHPNNRQVNSLLAGFLCRWEKIKTPSSPKIQHDDFLTIRVHLSTVGLVNTAYSKTTKGGMALFWSLTGKGRSLMRELRSVRRDGE